MASTTPGIMITETTITQFVGLGSGRQAGVCALAQSACSMPARSTSTSRIIEEGNNGGYANDWLIGDRKTGEIAYLELGLKNTPLWRSKDGYFISSNFARDPAADQKRNRWIRSPDKSSVDERAPGNLGG